MHSIAFRCATSIPWLSTKLCALSLHVCAHLCTFSWKTCSSLFTIASFCCISSVQFCMHCLRRHRARIRRKERQREREKIFFGSSVSRVIVRASFRSADDQRAKAFPKRVVVPAETFLAIARRRRSIWRSTERFSSAKDGRWSYPDRR